MEIVETIIAAPAAIPHPAETTTLAETAIRIPAVHADRRTADAARTETADRPDLISRTLHPWMIRHFPEEMTEDARPADVNRIPKNKEPLDRQTDQGFILPVGKLVGHNFFPVFVVELLAIFTEILECL